MKFFKRDIPEQLNNASGIYKITNNINGKIYVGKTHNFRKRYTLYKSCFKRQDVHGINEYFLNSINKYGAENFTFSVIEACDINLTAEREMYWIISLNTLDSCFGYNLRLDSSTGLVVQQSTRDKISNRVRIEYEQGIRKPETVSKFFSNFWTENPEIKETMRQNVSKAKLSYFLQSTREGEPLKLWQGINQVIENNIGYKFQNIYAACNGNKNTYMGFKWQRFDSIPEKYLDYLVRLDFSYGNAVHKQTEGIFDKADSPRKAKWVYKITCKNQRFVVLFGGLGVLESAVSSRFSYHKTNTVVVKGCTVIREAFDPARADFKFFTREAERLHKALLVDDVENISE